MSKTIEMDGYTYTLPFTVDVANNDLVDANGGYFGMYSISPEELVTVAAALNDYRPWRYPSRREWPTQTGEYEVTTLQGMVVKLRFNGRAKFVDVIGTLYDVRAWRELPAPAPVIEEEKA